MEDAAKKSETPQALTIPPQIATEIRTLLHDMGNALEIVVQAEYLLTTVEGPPEASKEWLSLLRRGTEQTLQLNQKLREYVRAHG